MSFNVNAKKTQTFGGNTPVWLEVRGVKPAGGSLIDAYIEEGRIYPAGTPVYLDGMGGNLVPFEVFELQDDVSDAQVTVKVAAGSLGTIPNTDTVFMLMPATGWVGEKAAAPSAVQIDASGFYDLTITANDFGDASEGDFLVIADSSSGKTMISKVNGLLWNDIEIEVGATAATGAVVDDGRVLASRIPYISDYAKSVLSNIQFEEE
jgi:hypothetical protein